MDALLFLMFMTVIVNETVDVAISDALLEDCKGHVEISGNSKLVRFKGTVTARNATLEIVDSEIDALNCYNSKIGAYHNSINFVQLENCSLTASLNTFANVIGKNSTYRNAWVNYSLITLMIDPVNKTRYFRQTEPKLDYLGNNWLFRVYANEPVDEDRDYISDNLVCVKNIRIDGSHYCEKVLIAHYSSYAFHGAVKDEDVAKILNAEPSWQEAEEAKKEDSKQETTPEPKAVKTAEQVKTPVFEAAVAAAAIAAAFLLARRWAG